MATVARVSTPDRRGGAAGTAPDHSSWAALSPPADAPEGRPAPARHEVATSRLAAAARPGATSGPDATTCPGRLPGGTPPAAKPDGDDRRRAVRHPTGRGLRAAALAGVTAVTGYVFLLDPDREGAYPLCPSRTLLGLDCPLCGGLRGTHALLHGRVGEALDHNVLLPGVLAVLAVLLGLWLLPLVGRPARRLPVPRWLGVAALALLVAFGVARNLPIDGLQYLASDA
jgi:hypothetical protein